RGSSTYWPRGSPAGTGRGRSPRGLSPGSPHGLPRPAARGGRSAARPPRAGCALRGRPSPGPRPPPPGRACSPAAPAPPRAPRPRLRVFSGADRAAVRAALAAGRESDAGPARLVIVAGDDDEYAARARQALAVLEATAPWPVPTPGIVFRDRPLEGELAFVFAGPAGAYRGMGRDLLLALPELSDAVAGRFASIEEATGWVYRGAEDPTPTEMLWGASLMCQVHAELARSVLGLRPQAAIGFCSGETNALFALGAWSD